MQSIHIPFIITILWIHLRDFLPRIRPLLIKFNIYAKIDKWIETKMSRKLILLYVVIVLATLGTFVPPIIVWVFGIYGKTVPPFTILGSTEWVSMISLVVTTYFGSNVWEKHVALSNGVMPNDMKGVQMQGSVLGRQAPLNVNANNQADDPDKEALKDALKHGK